MLGEPLALELANTAYAVRGQPQEGLPDPAHLRAWLARMQPRLKFPLSDADLAAVADVDLAAALGLRAAIRALVDAVLDGQSPGPNPVDVINRQVRGAPRWPELTDQEGLRAVIHSSAPGPAAALAEIAEDAIDLCTGPRRGDLRACYGPGCVLLFLKHHPRREWCSSGCGNRARASRHYHRNRGDG